MGEVDLGNRAWLVSLTVGDDPAAWESAGFTVNAHQLGGAVHLGTTTVILTGSGGARGITSWDVAGLSAPDGEGEVDGIVTSFVPAAEPPDQIGSPSAPHPNGTIGLDHVVIATPDLDRTTEAFSARSLQVRRIRETTVHGSPVRQAFLRLGPTLVEVVGPDRGTGQSAAEVPASWFGLTVDVSDLNQTAILLGSALGSVRDAVQPGRRIATLRHRPLDISTAIAFMDGES